MWLSKGELLMLIYQVDKGNFWWRDMKYGFISEE